MTSTNTTRTETAVPLPLDIAGREAETAMCFSRPATGTVVYSTMNSPIGDLLLTADGTNLTGIFLDDFETSVERMERAHGAEAIVDENLSVFDRARGQLDEYFAGTRKNFDLPLAPKGTDFQCAVWTGLTTIAYGATSGYGELAGRLGRPMAARAVGAANGKNPISIVVPCHRVIGANGSLTGYAWGEEKKRALLDLEAGR